jgi:hypothetical protein
MRPAPQPTHRYPTDLGLLNLARLDIKKIIDLLYKHIKAKFPKKPITDRNLGIIDYLVVTGGKTILPKQKNKSDSKKTPIYQKKVSSY